MISLIVLLLSSLTRSNQLTENDQLPTILNVSPSIVDGESGDVINISTNYISFENPLCKFGDKIQNATILQNGQLSCPTPEIFYNEILLSFSPDGQTWSQTYPLSVNPAPNTTNVYTFYIFMLAIFIIFIFNQFNKVKPSGINSITYDSQESSDVAVKKKKESRSINRTKFT